MSRTTIRVQVTKDDVGKVLDELRSLVGKSILVGVPESTADRNGPITNAAIAYLMEFGSPAQNVPARPFLILGVQKAESKVLPHLKSAIEAALDDKPSRVNAELHAAGEIAVAHVRKQIDSNIPPPLSPATIRNRKYARGTQSRRAGELEYAKLIRAGIPDGAAQSAAGIKSLVNSGQLLRSVTFVVRDDGHHPHHSHDADLPGKDSSRSISRPSIGVGGAAEGAASAAEGVAGEIAGAVGAIIP